MLKKILFCIFIAFSVKAQFVDGLLCSPFAGFPQSKIHISGIGNRGFDDNWGIYNPVYSDNNEGLTISSGLMFTPGTTEIFHNNTSSFSQTLSKSDWNLFPEFSIKYKTGMFQFNLSLYNDIIFSYENGIGFNNEVYFKTTGGYYQYHPESTKYETYSRYLQFSVSTSLTEELSLSLGIMSNYFNLTNDFGEVKLNYNIGWLQNFQYLISLNVVPSEYVKAYLLFKSQLGCIPIDGGNKYNGQDIFAGCYYSQPGTIGYGVQVKLIDNLKISAEASHQFIIYSGSQSTKYTRLDADYHVWGHEITIGANYKFANQFTAGLSFSTYIDMHQNPFNYTILQYGLVYWTLPENSLYYLNGALKYEFSSYSIIVSYQYSHINYAWPENEWYSENGHYIKIEASIHL